ncbi:MAG: hypothetical protein HY827_03555 [Actinobacteria bacterium]|nr:hypothetical protein [Actinomycetota bacterium]
MHVTERWIFPDPDSSGKLDVMFLSAQPGHTSTAIFIRPGKYRTVKKVSDPSKDDTEGNRLCKSGAITSTTCGVLKRKNYTVTNNDKPFLRGQRYSSILSRHGDSGGAIFLVKGKHSAYGNGIVSSAGNKRSRLKAFPNTDVYDTIYDPLKRVESETEFTICVHPTIGCGM